MSQFAELQNATISLEERSARPPLPQAIYSILRRTFQLDEFRPYQARAVALNLDQDDSFLIMPTSGGKSLTYQLPAVYHWEQGLGLTVVVSPLIPLIRDQIRNLTKVGIAVAFFDSLQSPEEEAANLALAKSGNARLLYVSPERFTKRQFQRKTLGVGSESPLPIAGIVLDEAHTIADWGHDFRPALGKKLGQAIWRLQENTTRKVIVPSESGEGTRVRPPVQLCTATAPTTIRDDIIKTLDLGRPTPIVQGELDRANLMYSLRHFSSHQDKLEALGRELVNAHREPTIVYCAKRALTEEVQEHLRQKGYRVRYYHAGMTREDRIAVQEDFIQNRVDILVATTAFGMGIDKPNVRRVIHFNLPKSLEQYSQESGRAGRDGTPARCMLWVVPEDAYIQLRFINLSNPDRQFIQDTFEILWKFVSPPQKAMAFPRTEMNFTKFLGEDEKERKAPFWYYALRRSALTALEEHGLISINGWNLEFLCKPAQFEERFPDEEVRRAKKERELQALKILLYYANQQSTRDLEGADFDQMVQGMVNGKVSEGVLNSHLRTLLLKHLTHNLLVNEAVRFKHPADLIDIDSRRILRVVERVARRDWDLEHLKRYLHGRVKGGAAADAPFANLTPHEIDAVIKHAAYLGYIRLHSRGELSALALTEKGREFVIQKKGNAPSAVFDPSTAWEELRDRIGHYAERHTLRESLFDWFRNYSEVGDEATLRKALQEFGRTRFTILKESISGKELTQQYCHREKIDFSDMRALLSYIFGCDPLQGGIKVLN